MYLLISYCLQQPRNATALLAVEVMDRDARRSAWQALAGAVG